MSRNITNYMNREQGRKVTECQIFACQPWYKLTDQIEQLRMQREVFENSGLIDAAKRATKLINEKEIERRRLEDELNEQRISMNRMLLVCFAACDIATTAADLFAELMHKVTLGYYPKDNDFSKQIREQADSFNRIVRIVDDYGHMPLAMFYADMADEVTEKVIPIIKEIINKHANTAKGKRYF